MRDLTGFAVTNSQKEVMKETSAQKSFQTKYKTLESYGVCGTILIGVYMDGINKNVFVILGNLQKKYFGAWRMSKGKGAAPEEEKPKEKSPERSEESEDEEVSIVCVVCVRVGQ